MQVETIKTAVWVHNTCARFGCIVCGELYRQYNAACSLFEGTYNLGDICGSCLTAGQGAAVARLQSDAAQLREARNSSFAAQLEARAQKIAQSQTWSSPGELRFAEENAQLIAETDQGDYWKPWEAVPPTAAVS